MNKFLKTPPKPLAQLITGFFLLICLYLISCENPTAPIEIEPENPTEGLTDAIIRSILQNGGEIDDPETRNDTVSTTSEEEVGGVRFSCTRSEVDAAIAPDKFFNFDPNADVIIAGNLLAGNSLQKATPDRVPLRRGPAKISLSLFNGSNSVSGTMDEYTPSNYFETVNDILLENSGIVPARFNFTIEEVKSEKELELAFQANANNLGLLKASLSFSSDQEKKFNRFVVLLNQTYFSVLFDRPSTLRDFFHPDVTAEEISNFVGPLNPLTYVSSLNVGRQFALLIESTESSSVIEASANACFRGNCAGGSAKVINELQNLRVKVFALGGDANQLLQAVTTDVTALTEFLASSGDIRTGVPLSYVVRTALEDRVVKNEVTTKFTIENCVPIEAQVCDCFHKGDSCEIETQVIRFNERTVQSGSGSSEKTVNSLRKDEVVVGMRVSVNSRDDVNLLHLIVKTLNPDGSLSQKRIVRAAGSSNGNPEISFEAPGNAILTGIGLRVSGSNVNRARFRHREISLDEEDCQFKFGQERESRIGSQRGLEHEYRLTQDYGNKVACIKGLSVSAADDNIRLLKVEVGELKLD